MQPAQIKRRNPAGLSLYFTNFAKIFLPELLPVSPDKDPFTKYIIYLE